MRSRTFGLTIAGMIGGAAALGWVVAIWTANRVTAPEVPVWFEPKKLEHSGLEFAAPDFPAERSGPDTNIAVHGRAKSTYLEAGL
jgi:hypothetical protein